MQQFEFSLSPRVRRSPFYDATVEDGVTGFSPYNGMLMPVGYGDPEAEYWRIINAVSMWDVAVERQVEIAGPDAGRLAQTLCPRDLSRCVPGQGLYVPMCNHAGTLINDPVLLKLSEDRYWLSIADSDVCLFARAIAAERGLDVHVHEPDVSPLAVQGPRADDTVASLFGDWVRSLRHFWFREAEVEGIPVQVARSGWSKQGGFELYLMDGSRGADLWRLVREAGKPFGIGPGNPNVCERIEGGLLSYGGDTDDSTNPFEVRLGKYVDLGAPDDVVGIQALRRIAEEGPRRHQLGAVMDLPRTDRIQDVWHPIEASGGPVGFMTNGVWSRRLERYIGFALVERSVKAGDSVRVSRGGAPVEAELVELPFVRGRG